MTSSRDHEHMCLRVSTHKTLTFLPQIFPLSNLSFITHWSKAVSQLKFCEQIEVGIEVGVVVGMSQGEVGWICRQDGRAATPMLCSAQRTPAKRSALRTTQVTQPGKRA